jgi:hypothetical protein
LLDRVVAKPSSFTVVDQKGGSTSTRKVSRPETPLAVSGGHDSLPAGVTVSGPPVFLLGAGLDDHGPRKQNSGFVPREQHYGAGPDFEVVHDEIAALLVSVADP